MNLKNIQNTALSLMAKYATAKRDADALCESLAAQLVGKEVAYRVATEATYRGVVDRVVFNNGNFLFAIREKIPHGGFSQTVRVMVPITKIVGLSVSAPMSLVQQSAARENQLSL